MHIIIVVSEQKYNKAYCTTAVFASKYTCSATYGTQEFSTSGKKREI